MHKLRYNVICFHSTEYHVHFHEHGNILIFDTDLFEKAHNLSSYTQYFK